MLQEISLEGKTALITGGEQGLVSQLQKKWRMREPV